MRIPALESIEFVSYEKEYLFPIYNNLLVTVIFGVMIKGRYFSTMEDITVKRTVLFNPSKGNLQNVCNILLEIVENSYNSMIKLNIPENFMYLLK